MTQATAADGWQQLVCGLGGQDKFDRTRRFFKRFKQRVGRDAVHALGREDQHHLGRAARAGELGERHHLARGIDLDFFAGLAFFTVEFVLGFLVEWPAELQRQNFWHQHSQIGVCVDVNRMATAAHAASALRAWVVAQPGFDQCLCQFKLAQPGRASQQPGVAALCQQAFKLGL